MQYRWRDTNDENKIFYYMSNFLQILLIFFSFSFIPQNETDSTSAGGQEQKIEKSFPSTQEMLEQMEKKNDSLNSELLFYRIKEDYYSTALSDQGTRFALIASGLLLAFTILSYAGFRHEIRKFKKESDEKVKKIKKAFNREKKNINEMKAELYGTEGNLYAAISEIFLNKKDYFASFQFVIQAATAHKEYTERAPQTTDFVRSVKSSKDACIALLGYSITLLEKSRDVKKDYTSHIERDDQSIQKWLKGLIQSENEDVRNLSVEVYSKYQDFKRQAQHLVKTNSTAP